MQGNLTLSLFVAILAYWFAIEFNINILIVRRTSALQNGKFQLHVVVHESFSMNILFPYMFFFLSLLLQFAIIGQSESKRHKNTISLKFPLQNFKASFWRIKW